MMLMINASAALTMGVLLGSTAMITWSSQSKGKCVGFAKNIGYIVFVLSLLSLSCIGYHGYKAWSEGAFDHPTHMHMGMKMGMMEKMMEKMGGMMKDTDHSHMVEEKASEPQAPVPQSN